MRGLFGLREGRAGSAIRAVAGSGAGALGAFLAALVAARSLSRPEFALFGVGLAVYSLSQQLVDIGLGSAAVVETARGWARGDQAQTYRHLLRLVRHRILTAVLLVSVIVAVALLLPVFDEYREVVVIAAGGSAIGSLCLFQVAALQAARRFGAAAALAGGLGLGRLALVSLAAAADTSPELMLAGYAVVAPGVAAVVGALVLRVRGGPSTGEGEGEPTPRHRRPLVVAFVTSAFLLNVDVLILVVAADKTELAIYAAAWRVAAGVILLSTALAGALLPYVMLADDVLEHALGVVRLALRVSAGLLVLVPLTTAVGLALLGDAGDGAGETLAVLLVAFASTRSSSWWCRCTCAASGRG